MPTTDSELRRDTAGGTAADHPVQRTLDVLVGPTTEEQFNTVKAAILPFACWRVDDMRFEFDSSIVLPEMKEEFDELAALIDKHTRDGRRPPASVFGHADPVGNDAYNKQLSGRRAAAVYGVLARDTDLWEELYSQPLGGDDWKQKQAVPRMLGALGYGSDSAEVKRFQQDHGAGVDGVVGPETRKALFKAYMDAICPITLSKQDFLGRGEDPGGKADYQGCSEFNPALLFSQQENQELSKPQNKPKRDSENAPNRRVMVFLFRPGTRIDVQRWPCPRAKEDSAACRKRFWSDGEQRRSFQEKRREFKDTQDTFACRFYHRLSDRSPCERTIPLFRIRLFDLEAKAMAGAPFLIKTHNREARGTANNDGDAFVRDLPVPAACDVFWSRKGKEPTPSKPEDFDFQLTVHVTVDETEDEDSRDAAVKRLHNFGYTRHPDLEENVKDFQVDMGKTGEEVTGEIDDIKDELKKRHEELDPPPRNPPSGDR